MTFPVSPDQNRNYLCRMSRKRKLEIVQIQYCYSTEAAVIISLYGEKKETLRWIHKGYKEMRLSKARLSELLVEFKALES